MAITKSFNGKTIRKPGSYSKYKMDNSAGAPIDAADVIFIIGESAKGAPGSTSGITEYAAERLSSLVDDYGSGPLVDCAIAAAKPSKQQGINGASKILVYKTNASVQASKVLQKSSTNVLSVKDRAYGIDGNKYQIVVAAGSSANQKTISIPLLGGTTESLGENDANVCLTVVYTGNGSAAALSIAGASFAALTMTSTLTGASDGSANLSILLKNYTMKQLVDYINGQTGYTAVLSTASLANNNGRELDIVTALNIKAGAESLRRVNYELKELINTSARVIATLDATPSAPIIDNGTFNMTGGVQGISTNAYFSAGLALSLAKDYNAVSVAVSRDASVDIADAVQGFTDASSTYTNAAILTAMDTHLRLRGDTKNRREAQGFGGTRSSTKASAFAVAAGMNSEFLQVCIQDVLALDAAGELRYMHPHVLAAMAAGMRCGMAIGEPLTHKFANVKQIGQFINSETGLSAGEFNPGLDYDDAIDNGVLYLEESGAGFRWSVDNTTYGIDDSFCYNRGSVMSAINSVNKTLRETAELIFVGKKLPATGAAKSIKSAIRNKLRELNAPDVNIITSSDDAPEGFREDTFVVTVTGNTATVQVEYKPVQGLDFVFFDFTVGDVSQSA